jgi:hypothetical protein
MMGTDLFGELRNRIWHLLSDDSEQAAIEGGT